MPGIEIKTNTIRARQRDPGDFQKNSFKTITLDKSKGIKAVIGKLKGKTTTTTQSVIFPKKDFTVAQAKKWLKDHDMKSEDIKDLADKAVTEEFLDPIRKRWPLFYPAIFETLIDFNNGALYECGYYGWDQVSLYGRKLARKLTQIASSSVYDDEYDEEGRPTSSFSQSDGETKTMYKFHDGQVVVVRSRNSGDGEMEWEYSEAGEDGETDVTFSGEEIDILEAEHPGEVVKAMRAKKKMSRKDMSAMMNMTVQRLKEIEDGDEPDDDEMDEMAKALGMTKKKMKKMMAIAMPPDEMTSGTEEADGDFIEIIDDEEIEIEAESGTEIEFEIIDEPEIKTTEESDDAVPAVFESIGPYELDGRKIESHRLCGNIIVEEIRKDGTARFKVPMMKIGEYTANGNRYSQLCADEMVKDINKLHESQRDLPDNKRSSLDIRIPLKVAESLMEETFDMMPTHGPRISAAYGNPLTSKAGKIVGAYSEQEAKTVWMIGETIRTQAGKDMAVLIEEGMVKGVSLVGIPKVYENNGKGPNKKGLDVDKLHFLGGDFTDNPAMPFPEFADKETYFEVIS